MKKIERFIKGDTIIFRNVPVKWAKLVEPDRPSWGGSFWKIDMLLSKKQAADFKKIGFNVKVNGDGEDYLTCTRKEVTTAGKTQKPPKVIDRDGMETDENIGNGSVCNLKVWCKYWSSPSGTEGLKPYLDAVQIVDLVEYAGGARLGAVAKDDKTEMEVPF